MKRNDARLSKKEKKKWNDARLYWFGVDLNLEISSCSWTVLLGQCCNIKDGGRSQTSIFLSTYNRVVKKSYSHSQGIHLLLELQAFH